MNASSPDHATAQLRNDVDDLYEILSDIQHRLRALETTADGHTATLAEHTTILAEHGSKLDRILEILEGRSA